MMFTSRRDLKNDILGGITAGIVALPLALAFGAQSGMGPAAGLYSSIVLGFIAACLGGTLPQISGPSGPMTVVSAMVISTFIGTIGSLEVALPYILITFAAAGLFQIGFSLIRIGDLIRFVPYPVVSGFMSGIGLIIIILQFFPMMGHKSPSNLIQVFKQCHILLANPNYHSLALTVATLAIIYIVPRFFRAIPSSLIALITLTVLAVFCTLPVATIGHIPSGLPSLHLTIFHQANVGHHLWKIVEFALILAALSSIDSLLTSVVVDNLTHTQHNSHKELFGQGVGNFVGALVGAIPGAGTTMRSVINIKSGGRNRLSGITHSILLLIILLGANRYAALIPTPVLSGILISVGIGIIDYRGFKQVFKVPLTEAIIMIGVTLITVFVDLLTAVGVGVLFAAFGFMKTMTDMGEKQAYTHRFEDESKQSAKVELPEHLKNKVYVKQLEGPLFFAIANQCKTLLTSLPDIRYVVIRMRHVPYIDQSGAYALEDALRYLKGKGIDVLMVELQDQPKDILKKLDIIPNTMVHEHLFPTFDGCCKWLQDA